MHPRSWQRSRFAWILFAVFSALTALMTACHVASGEQPPDAGTSDDAGAGPEATTADAGPITCPAPAAALCNDAGWCWSNPLPQGMDLDVVWGSAADDVWAAGQVGTMLHWNGSAWALASSGTSNAILDMWGSGPNDIWAVGDNAAMIHWDGSTWAPVSTPATGGSNALRGIWGASANDIWVVGFVDLMHWDGHAWTTVTDAQAYGAYGAGSVWGTGPNDVWITAGRTGILRWNGSVWAEAGGDGVKCGVEACAHIWGSGPNDVYAVGDSNVWNVVGNEEIWHWNGSAWTSARLPTLYAPSRVWGTSASDVWVAGEGIAHWNGSTWATVPADIAGGALLGIWGSRAADVWAVGRAGTILRWTGAVWTTLSSGATNSLAAVWGSSANDVWAGGGETMLHWNGCNWTSPPGFMVNDSGAPGVFVRAGTRGIWGSGANDVWAVGDAILHWDGAAWATSIGDASPPVSLAAVWGSSASDVWAVGDGILHWNGSNWAPVVVDAGIRFAKLTGVWGSGPSDVWAVGGQPSYIVHWDGAAWSRAWEGNCYQNACSFAGIWGSGADDVWAVGNGDLVHWDGHAWTEMASTAPVGARAIWGNGTNDIWLASAWSKSGPVMEHWDGHVWTPSPNLTATLDTAIWGTSGAVWVVGQNGAIERHR